MGIAELPAEKYGEILSACPRPQVEPVSRIRLVQRKASL
jgi:hypothetical protein